MAEWSLQKLLEGLHDDIHQRLETARKTIVHPGSKGDASENIWLELFIKYLPKRYQALKGFVVDSKGKFSEQIDVIILDRQYSPFIFEHEGIKIVPAESVYAVFESKQTVNLDLIKYAGEKIQSVRSLHRTSLPIPHAGGTYPAKPPGKIHGGILSFESDWNPPMGDSLENALIDVKGIDFGCVAAHGYFSYNETNRQYDMSLGNKPATAFLFKLISELQFNGTVGMIDVLEYSKWLAPIVTL
jgi:hypothetical protein